MPAWGWGTRLLSAVRILQNQKKPFAPSDEGAGLASKARQDWGRDTVNLPFQYLSLRQNVTSFRFATSGPLAVPKICHALERGQILTASPLSPRFFRHRRRFGDGARQREERLYLTFGFIVAGTVFLPNLARAGTETRPYRRLFLFSSQPGVGSCRAVYGGRGDPPLQVVVFIAIAAGTVFLPGFVLRREQAPALPFSPSVTRCARATSLLRGRNGYS